jgi:hypothetical protein
MLLWRYEEPWHIKAGSVFNMTRMVFALLCFTGVLVMFFYVMRSLDKLLANMRNEHAQIRVQMRSLEARLDILTGTAPPPPASAPLPGDLQAPLALTPEAPLDDPLSRFEPRR